MDLGSIKTATHKLDILHPVTDEPTGLVLELQSPKSPSVKRLAQASLEKQRAASRRKKPFSAAQEEHEAIKINAACVVGAEWTGNASWHGERPDYSQELALDLLKVDWILTQVAAELQVDANFFGKPDQL